MSRDDDPTFDDSHLDADLGVSGLTAEMTLPDLYVGLEMDLLAPGDEVGIDRHQATSDYHEDTDLIDQISGKLSPATLSQWLRYGCEQVIQLAGATACHPGALTADDSQSDVPDRDLETGYHESGTCTDKHDAGCLVHELFGESGDQSSKLVRRPVTVSPNRQEVDVLNGEAHYRQSPSPVRPRNVTDSGQSLHQTDREVLGTIEGTWKLTLQEVKPEFVGVIAEAMSFLGTHGDNVALQIDGERPIDARVANAWLVNPLYTDAEIRHGFSSAYTPIGAMVKKDEHWRRDCRDAFTRAVQARTAARDGDLPVPTAGEKE